MKFIGFVALLFGLLAPSSWAGGSLNCPGTYVTVPFCDCGITTSTSRIHDCGVGHNGADNVYQVWGFTIGQTYRFIGEGSFDADWTIATVCNSSTGDILCVDRIGVQTNPSCSSLTHDSWGYMTFDWVATQSTIWLWVDGYESYNYGYYCVEVIPLGTPTPTASPLPTATPTPTPTRTPYPTVVCPPEGILEGEPECGPDYEDYYNGGCNSSPYMFQDIECGDVVCGVSGTYPFSGETYRDTDWYRLVVTSYSEITWGVTCEFNSKLIIMDAGSENCQDYTELISYPGGPNNSVTAVVYPGVYWLWVGTWVFNAFPCPLDYVAYVTCGPGPTPTPLPTPTGLGDVCSQPYLIDMSGWTPSGTNTFTTNGNTCNFGGQYNYYDYGCGINLSSPEVVYQFTPPVTLGLQIDLIGSQYDTMLVITNGCPEAAGTCMFNDEYGGGSYSGFDCAEFTGGVTYYLFVEGWNFQCGQYALNIEVCPLPTSTPTVIPPTMTPIPTYTPSPIPATPSPYPDCINDGDVNMNNSITAEDAQMAFAIAIGALQPGLEQFCAADCDDNGAVTAGDAQKIFMTIFGYDSCADPLQS